MRSKVFFSKVMKLHLLFVFVCLYVVITPFCGYAAANSNFAHDSSKPVEITADSLEVLQESRKAIFTGNVEAKQGEIDIRSERMIVYYSESGGKENDNKKQQAGKVSKVEIDRNVFISTPKETAEGNKGMYDVGAGLITLEGNVALTSGKNIVKGDKLVYNLKTGQSKIVSGSGSSNKKSGRVRGVFVPGGGN